MAVKWNEFEKDGDHYYIQYRTAGDSKVRAEHAVLNDTTLPISDPFWDEYLPPLDWGCRCTAVQVRKSKYAQSDSNQAIEMGERATAKPKQKIFRFNPGKTGKVFPPKHPYLPKGCGNCTNGVKLAYNPNSEQCRVCNTLSLQERIAMRKVEYQELLNDPNYKDVVFDESTGGLKATHIEHNFDSKKGWYEESVQNAGFKYGHSVIFRKETHNVFKLRNCEGLWDNKLFEIAGAENGTNVNIRNALKHCASKKRTKIAILFFPEDNFNLEEFNHGYERFHGLRGSSQFLLFDEIYCINSKEEIFYTKKPSE